MLPGGGLQKAPKFAQLGIVLMTQFLVPLEKLLGGVGKRSTMAEGHSDGLGKEAGPLITTRAALVESWPFRLPVSQALD